jgi:hypothetical protein
MNPLEFSHNNSRAGKSLEVVAIRTLFACNLTKNHMVTHNSWTSYYFFVSTYLLVLFELINLTSTSSITNLLVENINN